MTDIRKLMVPRRRNHRRYPHVLTLGRTVLFFTLRVRTSLARSRLRRCVFNGRVAGEAEKKKNSSSTSFSLRLRGDNDSG